MMKYFQILIIITSLNLNAQIVVEKFDLNIETNLSDTLQTIYGQFLNNNVEKISIVKLKKQYNHSSYYDFLRNKRFYQSRKKWLRNNSINEESIIIESSSLSSKNSEYSIFEYRFNRVDREFIKSELFLDSLETKLALKEMFNGDKNHIMDMCYIPRHAVIFYNAEGETTGIYEICFECSNVKIGIIGTIMFARDSPYLKSLFEKYKNQF